jgi:hypothetical protein
MSDTPTSAENNPMPDQQSASDQPTVNFANPAVTVAEPVRQASKLTAWLLVIFGILLFLTLMTIAGFIVLLPQMGEKSPVATKTNQHHVQATASATPTASPTPTTAVASKPDCGDDSVFADKQMGMAFCYPIEWGVASVVDNRIAPTDTGYRQSVTFSNNSLFSVGGTSENWATSSGRGVGCLEPNNVVVAAADYDTSWNGIQGSGSDIMFAKRSIATTTAKADVTETVDDMVMSGVCVQAHKVIDGSRYKVAFAAFHRAFSEGAGIVTPKQHMDEPNVLFDAELRSTFQKLVASIKAY